MSIHRNHRLLAIVVFATGIAGCSTNESTIAGLQSASTMSVTAAAISVDYLPMPDGVPLTVAGLSAGGFIFGKTSSASGPIQPYAWTSPYATSAAPIAPEGFIGGLDDANDAGDIRGALNGAGFWARGGSDWQFTYVNVGAYSGVSVSSVNNARSVAGWGTLNGTQRALWWSDASSQPTELPTPALAGTFTGARALAANNVGDVVGEVREQIGTGRKAQARVHAVVWKSGPEGWQATLLQDVGTENRAYDVNDAGQVAGNASIWTAVLWTPSNGVYGSAVVVSTSQGALTKVDRCGRVVGYTSANTPNKRKAYVWENGVTTYLPNPEGAVATSAESISTDLTTGEGIIVGGALTNGQPTNGSFVPVRWTIPGCP